jgi:hypothetical protein
MNVRAFAMSRASRSFSLAVAAGLAGSAQLFGCGAEEPGQAADATRGKSAEVALSQARASVSAAAPASAPVTVSAASTPYQSPAASAPAGGVALRFEKEYAADYGTAVAVEGDAEDSAKSYLVQKEWRTGRNGDPATGFLVVLAKAPIVAGDAASFDQRRRQAAKEAMLQAKKSMTETLAAEVETSTRLKYVEGAPPMEEIAAAASVAPKQPGAIAKVKAILDYELDQQLKSRNIDPSLQTPEERAKAESAAKEAAREIIGTSQFRDAVRIAAEHELSGLQAFRTFESTGSGGSGQVAVICVYSQKSAELQKALLGLGPAPAGLPQQSIDAWVAAQGPNVLLYTHGVQVRTNEKGEVVLVGFGQSTPPGKSERLIDAASKKAKVQAMGELRRFMGELVATAESDIEASTYKDFADGTSEFKSQSRYEEEVSAEANKLLTPGALDAGTWSKRHPQSDRETQGCVVVWSVSEALEANALRDRLKAAGGASGGRGIGDKRPSRPSGGSTTPKPSGKPSSGVGAEGEQP